LEKSVWMLILVGAVFVVEFLCQKRGTQWQQPISMLASRIALTRYIPLSMISAIWQMPSFNKQLLLRPRVGAVVILTGTMIDL